MKRWIVGLAVVVVLVPVGQSQAAIVTIDNPSFEVDILQSNRWTVSVPDWPTIALAGNWRPPTTSYSSIPDGSQVAFSNNGGMLTQWTASTWNTAFSTYNLAVEVGLRKDFPANLNVDYVMELLATSDGGITSNVVASATGPVSERDAWQTITLSADNFATYDGETIGVRLSSLSDTWQVNYDNVRLSAIPEPTTLIIWSLLGTFAIGFGWYRRRKAAV